MEKNLRIRIANNPKWCKMMQWLLKCWRNWIEPSWCLKRLDNKPVEWQKQILKVVKLKMKKLKWHLSLMLCQDNETFACESHDSWLKHLVEDLHWPKPNQEERKQASAAETESRVKEKENQASQTAFPGLNIPRFLMCGEFSSFLKPRLSH